MASHPQLEHGGSHSRKAFDALPHPSEYVLLLVGKGAQRAIEQKSAISTSSRQWGSEIVYRPSQEIGSILFILLELQVCLDQALQHLIAIQTKRMNGLI